MDHQTSQNESDRLLRENNLKKNISFYDQLKMQQIRVDDLLIDRRYWDVKMCSSRAKHILTSFKTKTCRLVYELYKPPKLETRDKTNIDEIFSEASLGLVWYMYKKKLSGNDREDLFKKSSQEFTLRNGSTGGVLNMVVELRRSNPNLSFTDDITTNWVIKYAFLMREITLESHPIRKDTLNAYISFLDQKKRHMLTFCNEHDALSCFTTITSQQKKEEDIANKKLEYRIQRNSLQLTDDLRILIDIVSAQDLVNADKFGVSDPYVVISKENDVVHKTKCVKNTLDPIWTISTGSVFLLEISARDLFKCVEGICFEVRDNEKITSSQKSLGIVYVAPEILYNARGERLEFALKTKGMTKKVKAKGILVLRFKHADYDDIEFMNMLKKNEKSHYLEKYAEVLNPHYSMASVYLSRGKSGDKFRVRPYPDPDRVKETTWMTSDQINAASMAPSKKWIEAGSGEIGRVFIEIINCQGLPNKAKFGNITSHYTDSFVCVVFEDAFVTTYVIPECLNPVWLPWCKRAFIMNTEHPLSPLYIGVFDCNTLNSVEHHDPVGRITVNLGNIPINTNCVLTYDLYNSARVEKRSKKGKITFRIRVEHNDPRAVMLSALQIPPSVFINCPSKKVFAVLNFTCFGKYDRYTFSWNMIANYIGEIYSYEWILTFIQDYFTDVFFWRCGKLLPLSVRPKVIKVPYCIKDRNNVKCIYLPLRNLVVFAMGVLIVERPVYIPSVFFGFLAYAMSSIFLLREKNPSPWRRPPHYMDMLRALIQNKPFPSHQINANENEEETKQYIDHWENVTAEAKKKTDIQREAREQLMEEYERFAMPAEHITGFKKDKHSINPLKPYLFPIQIWLAYIIDILRTTRNIIMWDEVYYSFWITSILLVLSLVCLLLPWGFILKWIARIVVWAFLGPWMKLVDIKYIQTQDDLCKSIPDICDGKTSALSKEYEDSCREARMKMEEQTKLFDMKRYRFGKYIINVPLVENERHSDLPTIESYGKPSKNMINIDSKAELDWIPGQNLSNDILPQPISAKRKTLGFSGMQRLHCSFN